MKFFTATATIAAAAALFSNAFVSADNATDNVVIRDLMSKVEMQGRQLAKISAKLDAQDADLASLESVPQGHNKKNTRRGLRQEGKDAADAEDVEPQSGGLGLILYALIAKLEKLEDAHEAVHKCVGYNGGTNSCTVGGGDIDSVHVLADDQVRLYASDGRVDIDAYEKIEIRANVALGGGVGTNDLAFAYIGTGDGDNGKDAGTAYFRATRSSSKIWADGRIDLDAPLEDSNIEVGCGLDVKNLCDLT